MKLSTNLSQQLTHIAARFFGIVLFGFLFVPGSAFAADPMEALTATTSDSRIALTEAFIGTAPNGKAAFAARAGQYVAVQENSLGTLYRGPAISIVLQIGSLVKAFPGGIWIPKTPERKPLVYVYEAKGLTFKTMEEALKPDDENQAVQSPPNREVGVDTSVASAMVTPPNQGSSVQGAVAGVVVSVLAGILESQQKMGTPMLLPRSEAIVQVVPPSLLVVR